MKIERLMYILFTVLGIAGGAISAWIGDLFLSVLVPSALYAAATVALLKFFEEKRRKWMIYNGLVTFVLVWIVVWISLYNLG
jgi:hypothetical protein